MSCIAGVGGRVASLVNKANSGQPILALDGCPLQCVRGCLDQHGVHANIHLVLSSLGLRKRYGEDFSSDTIELVYADVVELISSDHMSVRQPATLKCAPKEGA
jgi:uncharacterized metal-binding protein